MSTLNLVVLVLATLVFLPSVDRLRHLNWKTAKSRYVLLHLAMGLWALVAAYDAVMGSADGNQLFGLSVLVSWCFSSAKTWSGGNPPTYAKKEER